MPLTEEQKRSLDEKGTDWRSIHYVEADEAIDGFSRGAMLVDTRKLEAFEAWYFKGAVNRRGKDAHLTLPREKPIYLFCT